ncbi:hypothetical protein GOP47_0021939 [Adiantum capillus-veneris]|uniref:Phosphoribulokinase/uridine kinase domain-containing protein n=1 Tax=Adiantum capillus-veneris TaxID=13818 RepID=A0A9D4U8S3_ADICA|nr:hypothetical protein GOP47_0021939 [Adiantum capillus-veneris]
MAQAPFLQKSNAVSRAELPIPATCMSCPSRLHHLRFSSSSLCRGKRLHVHLVQSNEKVGRSFCWSFQCSNQPHLETSQGDVEVLQASTMEEIYDMLAKRLLTSAFMNSTSSKYIVGMAGPPGAGKSTAARVVVERLNALWFQSNPVAGEGPQNNIAIALPMDGFHLYRSQLDMMEDPVEAHARRGAPWTFDPDGLIKCLQALRSQGCVRAPSFDHGVGDPKENDIIVTYSHKVIIVEGNYLLLAEDKWKTLLDIFDERWFLDVDIETTLKRVVSRFIAIGQSPDAAKSRVTAESFVKSASFDFFLFGFIIWIIICLNKSTCSISCSSINSTWQVV